MQKNNKRNNQSRKSRRGRKPTPVGPIGTVRVPRGPGTAAFPVAMRTNLRYFTSGTLTAGGANVYAEYIFRTNSLYDPDFTGVGTQPAGYAALSTLYARYRVLAAHITLTVVNDSGASVTVIMSQKAYSAAYPSVAAAATQGFARRSILSDQSGGKNQVTYKMNVQPWRILGVTKERYLDDDQFASNVGTNPVMTTFSGIGVHAVSVGASVQYQMDIIFDAVLFERAPLS